MADVEQPEVDYRLLRSKMEDPASGITVKDRTKKLSSYSRCFVATEAVDWLITQLGQCPRDKAVAVAQQMAKEGHFAHVVHPQKAFRDGNHFYRFYRVPTNEQLASEVDSKWVEQTLAFLDLDTAATEWTFEKELSAPPGLEVAKAFSRPVPSDSLKAFKVVARIRGPTIAQLVVLLHDKMVERHQEWNATFAEGAVIQKVSDDLNAQYWVFDPKKGMSKREFVVARIRVNLPGGAVALLDKSIEHGKRPTGKDMVRANLPFNVRHFRTKKDDQGEYVELNYVNLTDLGGWLPKALVNSVNAGISLEEIKHIVTACQNPKSV